MFRFTIRDVLWLMVVVGLACAQSVDGAEPTLKDLLRGYPKSDVVVSSSVGRYCSLLFFQEQSDGSLGTEAVSE